MAEQKDSPAHLYSWVCVTCTLTDELLSTGEPDEEQSGVLVLLPCIGTDSWYSLPLGSAGLMSVCGSRVESDKGCVGLVRFLVSVFRAAHLCVCIKANLGHVEVICMCVYTQMLQDCVETSSCCTFLPG